jgi:ABC-2 type transport system permease protein
MFTYASAILWAQVRTLRNFYPRGNYTRLIVTGVVAAIWYGIWAVGAGMAGVLIAGTTDIEKLGAILATGLMAVMLYWQLIPILMVSAGAALDLKRLRTYPIPARHMFGLEVLLRVSNSGEMLLVIAGATVGMIINPVLPFWAPLGFIPFILSNLLLSAGLRNLLERLLARKYLREVAFLLLVSAAALPQVLLVTGLSTPVKRVISTPQDPWWPWSAGAAAILGIDGLGPWVVMLGWLLICFAFGHWQFERGLRFDSRAADVRSSVHGRRASFADKLFRLPSMFLPDPLGALIEKEVRSLVRSPRFRVVFVMGFTFGLLIWIPITLRGTEEGQSFFTDSYLSFVSLYALLLLGEVSFWNSFGFDRSSAQVYFALGISPTRVLIGKNISAVLFVILEVTAVAAICAIFQMPVTLAKLFEAYTVTLVLSTYMLGAGNLGSTHYPRAVDARQAWRSTGAGRFQAMLLLIYPLIAIPVALAFLARWALQSDYAFWGVLAFAAALGVLVYRIALDSSVSALKKNREKFLEALSAAGGPVSS